MAAGMMGFKPIRGHSTAIVTVGASMPHFLATQPPVTTHPEAKPEASTLLPKHGCLLPEPRLFEKAELRIAADPWVTILFESS